MDNSPGYIRHADRIGKEEFIKLFTGEMKLEEWFSGNELASHPFPRHAGSLAARYLVKKRIMDFFGNEILMKETEIMNDEYGKPEVILGEGIEQQMRKKGIGKIICSLSHSRNYAAAATVIFYK